MSDYESRSVKLPNSMWAEVTETAKERGIGKSKLLELAWRYYRDHLPPIYPEEEFSIPMAGESN